MSVVKRLRDLRLTRGYKTQKQFCSHVRKYGYAIDLRRYGEIERGNARPNIEEIIQICAAMEISADAWLLGRKPKLDAHQLTDTEVAVVNDLIRGLLSLR